MSRRRCGAPAAAGCRFRLPSLLAVGALAGVLLASCSSGKGSANGTTTTTAGGGTTTTSAGSSTTSSTATSTTTTGGGGSTTATCQPGQLSASTGHGTGAAGTLTLTMSLTNTSSATCELNGYPGMQLLDAQGNSLPTNVVRGQFHFPETVANQPPSTVRLAPGAAGTFALAYEDVPVGKETSCPTSAKVEVTPPNDYTHLVVTLSITPCNSGTVHVSPVYAAS